MGDGNHIRTLGDYSKPSHEGYRNTIKLPIGNNVVPLRSDTIRLVQNGCSFHGLWSEDPNQHLKDFLKLVDLLDLDDHVYPITTRTIDQFTGGKLRDLNTEESWALLEDLALYDNESWNDPRDFAKPVKAIALPQDVPSISNRSLIKIENQVQRSMESHLAPTKPTQVNKITTSCDIYSGPHDTQYCMEDPEQAFVEYASSRTDKMGGKWYTFKPEQNNLGDTYNPSWRSHPNLRLSKFEADFKRQQSEMTNKIDTVLKAITDQIAGTLPSDIVKNPKLKDDGEVMFIEIIRDDDEPQNEGPNKGERATMEGPTVEYFDTFPTRDELTYHKKLNPREDTNRGVNNFTRRIKGMHVFVGNFTYIRDFMIIEDISSIIDPRLSQVVLGKPFVEISNMTHDPKEGVFRFTNGNDEVAYKMPHKIEQYNSLSYLEKEHIKSVYFRNEEDKRRGVEYVMSTILGFYKECLELGPEYLTGMEDEGEVT
ncbi:hypothetical protein Tco_0925160 [Tanacetum coccineum]|uniref:MAK10-like protein n=1 Tax=Tanacetum coccineum TaxID=301880 RepID=A0ABQ5D903_9ASTR